MIHLAKLKESDYAKAGKLVRRIAASCAYVGISFPKPSFDEELFPAFSSHGAIYIAKEKGEITGLIAIDQDVSSFFYPQSHDGGKIIEIVNKTDIRMSEDMLALAYLGVDFRYRNKGIGRELLRYVESLYPRFLFLASLDLTNEKGIQFLRHCGYKRVSKEDFEFPNGVDQQVLFKRL